MKIIKPYEMNYTFETNGFDITLKDMKMILVESEVKYVPVSKPPLNIEMMFKLGVLR